ncbi:MAG: hypothetical protein JXR10_05190 [Cyclobacteriaceae bacterium]
MKTKIAVILLAVILAGCNTKVKKENEALKAEIGLLIKENESIRTKNSSLSASIDSYKTTLKEIDDNLKAIDQNAVMVGKIGADGNSKVDSRENILSRITSIKALLDNSKLKIAAMDKNLKDLRKKYGEQSEEVLKLSAEIKAQARTILEKETEFLIMQGELEEDIDELQFSLEQQERLTMELKSILNRAYYFSGTAKELKEKEIVDTEGGFIGLGRVKVLNANSKDGLFNQVKKDMTDTLTFDSKEIKFISEHPSDTYQVKALDGKVQLVITDKSAFWKKSNYLVVQTKK